MISVNCKQCGKSFEAKRKTAQFCSDLCRVNFNNGKIPIPEAKTFQEDLDLMNIQLYCKEIGIGLRELVSDHKKLRLEIEALKKAKNKSDIVTENNIEYFEGENRVPKPTYNPARNPKHQALYKNKENQ